MGVLSTYDIELCASIDMNQLDYISYLCVNINDYISEFREFLRRHVIIQTEEGIPMLGELSDALPSWAQDARSWFSPLLLPEC